MMKNRLKLSKLVSVGCGVACNKWKMGRLKNEEEGKGCMTYVP
jgi:hypothetical protein